MRLSIYWKGISDPESASVDGDSCSDALRTMANTWSANKISRIEYISCRDAGLKSILPIEIESRAFFRPELQQRLLEKTAPYRRRAANRLALYARANARRKADGRPPIEMTR